MFFLSYKLENKFDTKKFCHTNKLYFFKYNSQDKISKVSKNLYLHKNLQEVTKKSPRQIRDD